MKSHLLHIVFAVCVCTINSFSYAYNQAECEKQLRDAAALHGRRSIEYALAMSRMGACYADTLNPNFSKKKALQYFEPAATLAVSLADGTEQCADVLLPYIDFLLHTPKPERVLEYAGSLYHIFKKVADTDFQNMTRDEVLFWFVRHKDYSNRLFAMLDCCHLQSEHEDMLYNMCLIEKHLFSCTRHEGKFRQVYFQDIEKNLATDELAIEFASYQYDNNTFFTASVLRHNWKHPVKVSLFSVDESFSQMLVNKTMASRTEDLYNMVWDPLSQYFKRRDRIFFSPAGELHQLGIEYALVPYAKDTYMADVYRMHRLFSTSRLLKMKSRSNEHALVRIAWLFGDIDYGAGAKWFRLPDTRNEIGKIETLLKEYNYNVTKQVGSSATDDMFKSLSGKRIGIIHIATHGYYNYISQHPLLASGLVMAGGNKSFVGDSIFYSDNDGLLTALEAHNMSLPDTRLVVLSACKSGVGEVIADNVIGMQGALHYAGAEAVMTSLWDVNDEATSILMTNFYRNYLSTGKGLSEALSIAQKEVRKHTFVKNNNTYEGRLPKFWAAFIIYE